MTIHIWMHWFWITLLYKGFTVLLVQMVIPPLTFVVEAGLQHDNSNFYLFYSNFNYNARKASQTYIRSKRHIEDRVSILEETTYPSSLDYKTEILTNDASALDVNYRGSSIDTVDTYSGDAMDIFHQYPVKKYSKHSNIKYNKSKMKPKTSGEGGIPEKNVETLKVVEEKINISIEGEKILEESTSSGNETKEIVTDSPISEENGTMVVMINSTESSNETSSTDAGENNEEPILSDEPIKSDQITENIVENRKGTTKSRLNVTNVTEDQKVVQNVTELSVENKVDETVVHPTVEPFSFNNRVAAATSSENNKERLNQSGLDAGSITGITLGIVVISGLFGAISFVLYRRRYLNKPQALNDKSSNLDSSGYIDDTSFRENSEEMYSLDNDSFLNSLEAMTIQNYWTENVKHTKL